MRQGVAFGEVGRLRGASGGVSQVMRWVVVTCHEERRGAGEGDVLLFLSGQGVGSVYREGCVLVVGLTGRGDQL